MSIETIEAYLAREGLKHTMLPDGLIKILGNFVIEKGDNVPLDKITSVSGYVSVLEGATAEFPKLGELKFAIIDGIGCVVLSTKTKDGLAIMHCRKSSFKDGKLVGEPFFVASKGKQNAHGKTIREAIDELRFKTEKRDVSAYRNMPLTTSKTPKEWALVYRTVTGACKLGTDMFVESKGKLKNYYTLKEIIDQTEDAYGAEAFRNTCLGK